MRLHRHNRRLLSISLAALMAFSSTAISAPSPQASATKTTTASTAKQTLLRSREALDAYLAANLGHATPFDALPPLARRRFLESLVFGRNGLGGFDTGDLEAELTNAEVMRILELFDLSAYASRVKSRHPDTPPVWRAQQVDAGKVEIGFDTLYRLNQHSVGNHIDLRPQFDRLFADLFKHTESIRRLTEHELVYLMRSIELLSARTSTPADTERLRDVVAAMDEAGIAQKQDFRGVYDALLGQHDFKEATRYAVEHSDANLPKLPRMVDPFAEDAPPFSVWRSNGTDPSMLRTALDLGPTQILVTAGCHFAEDAAQDISSDPVLGPVFATHAHWLLLPPGQEDQDAVRDWNRRFPSAQSMQLYDRDEWKLLPAGWTMPTFLIVRDGKVLEKITGWPRAPATNRQLLIDALTRAALLEP